MKIVDMKCPNCGAALHVDGTKKMIDCKYCGKTIYLDDEVQHIKYDNAEQAGYEFEKGRQRAQAEQKAQQNRQQQATMPSSQQVTANTKKSKGCVGSCCMIFLWLCFFPIMLTIWIYRTDKIQNKKVKYGLIAALWILVFAYYLTHPSSSSKTESSSSVTTETSVEDVSTESESADAATTEATTEVDEGVSSTEASAEATEKVDELVHTTSSRDEIANEFLAKYNAVATAKITTDMIKLFESSTSQISITFPDAWATLDYPNNNDDRYWYDLRIYAEEFETIRKYYIDSCKALTPDADEDVLNQYFDQMVGAISERNVSESATVYDMNWSAVDGHPYHDYYLWLFMGSLDFTDD